MKSDNDPPISFATGGYDHVIRMWQTNTGQSIRNFQHSESQVNALSFSRDRRYLAAAGYDRVRLYDPISGNQLPVVMINDFARNVNAVGFNDNGQWMYAGGEDGCAKIIDLRSCNTGHLAVTRMFQDKSSLNTMLLHQNQCEILLGNERGELRIWDLRNDRDFMLWPEPNGGAVHSLAVNQEGNYLAAINAAGTLLVWSLSGHTAFKASPRHRSRVHSSYGLKVEFSPDSTLLVTCGADRKFNVLKTADFSVVSSRENKGMYWMWDCAFSADSRYLLTASSDGVARLWNLETGEVCIEYKGHQKAITCLAFRDQSLEEYC